MDYKKLSGKILREMNTRKTVIKQQIKLINTIHKYLIPDVSVKFVNIPELICGIELTNQSYQLASKQLCMS